MQLLRIEGLLKFTRHGWYRNPLIYAPSYLECIGPHSTTSHVVASTLFEMNSTCMRLCNSNFSCLSTSITSPKVSSCQNNKRIKIQYGRPCLHFVSSNFNFVNLWQWLKVLILFASFSISIINAYI